MDAVTHLYHANAVRGRPYRVPKAPMLVECVHQLATTSRPEKVAPEISVDDFDARNVISSQSIRA
jgi:hypothetical protein